MSRSFGVVLPACSDKLTVSNKMVPRRSGTMAESDVRKSGASARMASVTRVQHEPTISILQLQRHRVVEGDLSSLW